LSQKPASVRRARSEYCVTVELQPHELPPPPNAAEKVVDALKSAAMWAPELGSDILSAIQDLIHDAKKRASYVASQKEAA